MDIEGKYMLISKVGKWPQNSTNRVFSNEEELKKYLLKKFEKSCCSDFNEFFQLRYIILPMDKLIEISGKRVEWDLSLNEIVRWTK